MTMQRYCVLCCLFLAACSIAPEHNAATQALLAQGKAKLAANEWSNAKAAFAQILSTYDSNNAQAHFGMALAEFAALSDIVRYLGIVAERASNNIALLPAADDESRYLVELIGAAINRFRQKFTTADAHLQAAMDNKNFTFVIDSLPIFLTASDIPTLQLAGEWDAADAALLRAAGKFLLALLHGAASIDLRFNFTRAHAYFVQPDFDGSNYLHLLNLVVYVLNDPDFPDFLSLKAEGGADLLNQARLDLAAAAHFFEQSLFLATAESDEQSDDLLRYSGSSDGLQLFANGPDENFCDSKSNSGKASFSLLTFELGDSNQHPQLLQGLLCLLQKLDANLRWRDSDTTALAVKQYFVEQPRLNILHDLIPQVDAFAAALVRHQPKLLGGLPLPEGILHTAAQAYLGNSIELDPNAFFYADQSGLAGNIRGLLPEWQAAPCPISGLCNNWFVLEMECSPLPATIATFPAPLTMVVTGNDLPLCQSAWLANEQKSDSPHFNARMAADGFISIVPYVAMQSPSLHNVLWLDLAALGQRYTQSNAVEDRAIAQALAALDFSAGEFTRPTLLEFNAFVGALLSNSTIGGLLQTIAETFSDD